MKGKGYLFEVAAIGYLCNDEGDILETNIVYPITSILSKDMESAKFELIRSISDADIKKYGIDNIDLVVRDFNRFSGPSIRVTGSGNTLTAGTTGYITTSGTNTLTF